jgi:hypothetical protein
VLLAVLVLAAAVIAIASRMLPSTTPVTSPTLSTKMPQLFDDLEERTFRYFWDTADLNTGLVPDRYPTPSFSSIAAVGFALTAYPIGVERGYITREQARERVLTTLRFFYSAPQGEGASDAAGYKGFFYRFLDMTTGLRSGPIEVSTVDTALLLGGVLFCQSYFDSSNDDETAIRRLADEIYRRVDWRWAQARPPAISHGWTPEGGFIEHDWLGYNEAMLVYILALGSPTHPVDPVAWEEWGRGYEHYWGELYGQPHLTFTPLFGHQYSHVWIDFRGIVDGPMRKAGLDYFENSRRATYAQRAYAIENPMRWAGYGENIWGLTASDGSADVELSFGGEMRRFRTYSARGIGMVYSVDDGTIAPTAAAASLPFAPEIVIPAVEEMHGRYGEYIYGKYGFFDAFNQSFDYDVPLAHGHIVPEFGWVDNDYVGINQGPIVAMIENHRTGLIWRYTKRNPYIRRGLERAGFSGGWLDAPMPKAQSVTGDALFARWKTGCQAGLARTTDDDSREPGPAPSLGLLHACQQAAKSVAAGKGATEAS